MDIQAMQSMDWLFKKERIYLLAQFWQQRATLAEKEVSALKEQLATANQSLQMVEGKGGEPLDVIGRSGLEMELAAKEKEISQLVEDVQRLQASLAKLQETSANQIARLEEQLDHKRQHIARLEARLDAQRDYEDLKREISILRSIEFPAMGPGGSTGENKSLEMLLLERTKSLQVADSSTLKAVSNPGDSQDVTTTSSTTTTTPAPGLLNSSTISPVINMENAEVKLEGCPSTPLSPDHTPPSCSSFNTSSSSTPPATSLSLVNTTPAVSSPLASSTTTTTSTVVPSEQNLMQQQQHHHHHLMNGNPKTPPEDPSVCASNNNNNSQHMNNNNSLLQSGNSSVSNNANNLSVNSPIMNNNNIIPPPSSTPGPVGLSYFRSDDSMKSPFRFDDPRSPFRFSEDPGVMVGRLGESLIPKGDPMEARLQEMLRYNIDKYSAQNLDTLHISRRVRELLSINNIGQRLFAKYVLGLSQGTVSELLSKPKPWDKLTEKGRDSYRKMHAWACDENSILLLKSLIPKKGHGPRPSILEPPGPVPSPKFNNMDYGKDTGIPTFARTDADNMTEERIAHILSEASQMMKTQVEDTHSNDSKSPNQSQCHSPLGKDGSQNRRLKKYENDDIPQEKVVRIYQEELAKLMGRRIDEGMRGPREHFQSLLFPHFFSAAGGGHPPMDRTQEEIRMALDAYHRELAKLNTSCPTGGNPAAAGIPGLPGLIALQQQALSQHHHQQQQQQQQHQQQQQQHHAQLNGVAQDLSMPKDRKDLPKMSNGELMMELDKKDGIPGASVMESVADVLRHAGSAFSLVRPKTEPGTGGGGGGGTTQTSTGGSTASSPLSNSILPPAMTPADDFVTSAAASPLQRMASITNSLISQPSAPPHHSPSQRPLKAVLPPITQQQFDMYNNLNTEDIVKKVKEALSQYSISQRLFGESVLGLSQGSVSDLLARPKPWHMLTQKGREPFIRMKMFLEDDNAVHKLVASQYKIAPEKLMRTGSYAGGPSCPPMGKPQPPSAKMSVPDSLSGAKGGHLSSVDGPPILPPSLQQMVVPAPASVPPPPPPLLVTPPGSHHVMSSLQTDLKKAPHQPGPHGAMHPHHQSNALRAMQQHITPSVYEMAALTQDLDTQVITTKIKEALLANNIGQKIFGEAVLGLSQGSVSELLSKPKPWHMLSIKGREPFIRMQLWLSDAHNIDRLQALKNERREANKRRRSTGPNHHGGGGGGGADNSSDTSSNDTSEFYHSPSPGPGPPSAKKQRVLFSEEQKEALRLAFALDSYPNMATIEFLGAELALSSRTITNWFHNHRMRLKQQVPHGMSPEGGMGLQAVNREGGQQTFDPVQFRLLLNQRLLELQKERMGLGGVPLPYPPYFAANNNLAALIGRGLLPTADCDLSATLGGVSSENKEQFSGLDLSMGGLKRELNFEDEEDVDSNLGSEDSNLSSGSLREAAVKKEPTASVLPATLGSAGRSSRRKPAAPQWVNPEWQEAPGVVEEVKEKGGEKEVIINGVCVMQTDDYGIKLSTKDEETVRVEPTPVMDRYEDDDDDQCSEASSEGENRNLEPGASATSPEGIVPRRITEQGEQDDERRSSKSEPSSPTYKEEEEGENMQPETRHTLIKQEKDEQDVPSEEHLKEDWDSGSCKQEAMDKLQTRIKTEEQDDAWGY